MYGYSVTVWNMITFVERGSQKQSTVLNLNYLILVFATFPLLTTMLLKFCAFHLHWLRKTFATFFKITSWNSQENIFSIERAGRVSIKNSLFNVFFTVTPMARRALLFY